MSMDTLIRAMLAKALLMIKRETVDALQRRPEIILLRIHVAVL